MKPKIYDKIRDLEASEYQQDRCTKQRHIFTIRNYPICQCLKMEMNKDT